MTSIQPADDCNYGDLEGQRFDNLAGQPVRDSVEEPCLMCGGVGHWSSRYADALYKPPPGHKLEYLEGKQLVVLDSCRNHLVI